MARAVTAPGACRAPWPPPPGGGGGGGPPGRGRLLPRLHRGGEQAISAEEGAAHLISGLRSLEAKRPATTGTSVPVPHRSLQAISRYGLRANERAAEADVEIAVRDAQDANPSQEHGAAAGLAGGAGGPAHAAAPSDVLKAFQNIVAGIDLALAGGDASTPAKVVRKDESVTETVPTNGTRHYRVPLPSRPTAVTVALTRTAGAAPAIWGSTGSERPSSRNHDLKGKDDKLIYEHALLRAEGDEEQEAEQKGVDRRQAVPPCRELFIAVEATAGEVSYKLTVTFGSITIKLSRAEIASQVRKLRRGWEAKLAELKKSPAARELFDERIQKLQEERREMLSEKHKGVNYLAQNQSSLMEATPRNKLQSLQQRALKGAERQTKVQTSKQALEDEEEQRKLAWINRREDRRRQLELLEQSELNKERLLIVERTKTT